MRFEVDVFPSGEKKINKAVYLYVIVFMYVIEKLPLKNLELNFALFLFLSLSLGYTHGLEV